MPFFLVFIIIPIIEIGLFIEIGDSIGIGATLLLCFLTAIVGASLIRTEGLRTIFSIQTALQQGKMPMAELFDGMCLVLAGGLLIVPGFFTDLVGCALMVPPVRDWLRQYALPWAGEKAGLDMNQTTDYQGSRTEQHFIEAEYEIIEEDDDDEES